MHDPFLRCCLDQRAPGLRKPGVGVSEHDIVWPVAIIAQQDAACFGQRRHQNMLNALSKSQTACQNVLGFTWKCMHALPQMAHSSYSCCAKLSAETSRQGVD